MIIAYIPPTSLQPFLLNRNGTAIKYKHIQQLSSSTFKFSEGAKNLDLGKIVVE